MDPSPCEYARMKRNRLEPIIFSHSQSMLRQRFICCLQHTWWVLPSNCRASFNLLTWHQHAPTTPCWTWFIWAMFQNILKSNSIDWFVQICIFPDREFLQTTSKCWRLRSFGFKYCQYSPAATGVSWVQEILDLSPSHTPRFVTWHCWKRLDFDVPVPRVTRGLECRLCHFYHLRTCAQAVDEAKSSAMFGLGWHQFCTVEYLKSTQVEHQSTTNGDIMLLCKDIEWSTWSQRPWQHEVQPQLPHQKRVLCCNIRAVTKLGCYAKANFRLNFRIQFLTLWELDMQLLGVKHRRLTHRSDEHDSQLAFKTTKEYKGWLRYGRCILPDMTRNSPHLQWAKFVQTVQTPHRRLWRHLSTGNQKRNNLTTIDCKHQYANIC